MTHGIIIKEFKKETIYYCENRHCENPKETFYEAYSIKHIIDQGWTFRRADLWKGEKASGKNKNLRSSDGTLVELYCPVCSKK